MSKVAIVYFSESNNTKAAAEYVASQVDAKLVRVEAKGNTNPMAGMLKIAANPLGEPWQEVRDAQRIVLMSPVYAWNGIPVVLGFLKKAVFSGKEVLIVMSGGDTKPDTGMKVAGYYQKVIEKSGGKVTGKLYHQGGDYKKFSGADVIAQHVDVILDQILAWIHQ